jgi:hypothetical protein
MSKEIRNHINSFRNFILNENNKSENNFNYILMINPISDYFQYKKDGISDKKNPYYQDYEFNLIFDDNSHISAISFDDISLSVNALKDFYGDAKKWEKQTSGNRKIDDVKSKAKIVLLYSHNDEGEINKILSKTVSFKEHFDRNVLPYLQDVINIHMNKVGLVNKNKEDVERKKEFNKFKDDLLFTHYDSIEKLILIDKLKGENLYNKIKKLYIPQLA